MATTEPIKFVVKFHKSKEQGSVQKQWDEFLAKPHDENEGKSYHLVIRCTSDELPTNLGDGAHLPIDIVSLFIDSVQTPKLDAINTWTRGPLRNVLVSSSKQYACDDEDDNEPSIVDFDPPWDDVAVHFTDFTLQLMRDTLAHVPKFLIAGGAKLRALALQCGDAAGTCEFDPAVVDTDSIRDLFLHGGIDVSRLVATDHLRQCVELRRLSLPHSAMQHWPAYSDEEYDALWPHLKCFGLAWPASARATLQLPPAFERQFVTLSTRRNGYYPTQLLRQLADIREWEERDPDHISFRVGRKRMERWAERQAKRWKKVEQAARMMRACDNVGDKNAVYVDRYAQKVRRALSDALGDKPQ